MVTRNPGFLLLLLPSLLLPAERAAHPFPAGGALQHLAIASFAGSGQNSIQALATDSLGNLYVAGTTTSPDLPVKSAWQPDFADATLLRTVDLGTTWNRVNAPPDPNALIFPDPAAAQILFASARTGIYRSTDSGLHWRLVYPFSQSGFSQTGGSMAIDPGNHLHIVALDPSTGALFRSLDGGDTWTSGSAACGASTNCGGTVTADSTGSGSLLAFAFGAINLSRDWGASFQRIGPPGPGSPSVAAFDPTHRGWLYAGTAAGVMGGFWLSQDFGVTWTAKASPPTTFSAISNLAVDEAGVLLASTVDGIYQSTDGAATWRQLSGFGANFQVSSQYPFALLSRQCGSGGELAAIGSGGGVATFQAAFSSDYGATWTTPSLTSVKSLAAGPGCAVYVTRQASSDAFLSKLAPDGAVLWTTYFGGVDQDAPVALVVDQQGNPWLTGNTTSPDFPATVPRIGPAGQGSVFVARFTPSGQLSYSALIGGESRNAAVTLAVDRAGNAYVAGTTLSQMFPITAGAAFPTINPGSYTGFLVKLAPGGTLLYATYLGPSYDYPGALLANDDGTVIVAAQGEGPNVPPGTGATAELLMKFDAAGSRVLAQRYLTSATPYVGGPSSIALDRQGNLYIAGKTRTGPVFPGTPGYRTPPFPAGCPEDLHSNPTGSNLFVVKLAAADWSPLYSAYIESPCGAQAGQLLVDDSGSAILAIAADRGLPLRSPLLAASTCFLNSSAVVSLTPDGSDLRFATYFDNCGVPGIALRADGSLYAGVSPPYPSRDEAGVLHLALPAPPALRSTRWPTPSARTPVRWRAEVFIPCPVRASPSRRINLGLNPSQAPPLSLGGVR